MSCCLSNVICKTGRTEQQQELDESNHQWYQGTDQQRGHTVFKKDIAYNIHTSIYVNLLTIYRQKMFKFYVINSGYWWVLNGFVLIQIYNFFDCIYLFKSHNLWSTPTFKENKEYKVGITIIILITNFYFRMQRCRNIKLWNFKSKTIVHTNTLQCLGKQQLTKLPINTLMVF